MLSGRRNSHLRSRTVIFMKKHLHVFGASGSGTTTIAAEVSARLGYAHLDADQYYWLPTPQPFTQPRDPETRLEMLRSDLAAADRWVLSGSVVGWAETLAPLFDLAVFVYVPADLRIERLKKREAERYGARILPGGDRYADHLDFVAWAASYDAGTCRGRTLQKHEAWMQTLTCPVLRVENIDLSKSVDAVLRAAQAE